MTEGIASDALLSTTGARRGRDHLRSKRPFASLRRRQRTDARSQSALAHGEISHARGFAPIAQPSGMRRAPSVSSSKNGGQVNPYAFPLPLPRTLAASDPAKVASLTSYGQVRWNGPRTLGGLRLMAKRPRRRRRERLQG